MYLESWQNQFFDSGFLEVDWPEEDVSLLLFVFLGFSSSFESSLFLSSLRFLLGRRCAPAPCQHRSVGWFFSRMYHTVGILGAAISCQSCPLIPFSFSTLDNFCKNGHLPCSRRIVLLCWCQCRWTVSCGYLWTLRPLWRLVGHRIPPMHWVWALFQDEVQFLHMSLL